MNINLPNSQEVPALIPNSQEMPVFKIEQILRDILLMKAPEFDRGNFFLTELRWCSPDSTLALYTEELKETLDRNGIESSWENMKVSEFVENLGPFIFTGSCGNTSNILEEILCGSEKLAKALEQNPPHYSIQDLIENLRIRSSAKESFYCRVESGGHSFIVEFCSPNFRIYQSFFGRYTLARDFSRNATWEAESFLNLLEKALSPLTPEAARNQAQINLFNSKAVDTGYVCFRFLSPFSTLEEIESSYESINQRYYQAWMNIWDQPISRFLIVDNINQPLPNAPDERIETFESLKKLGDYFLDESVTPIDLSVEHSLEEGKTYYFREISYFLKKIELSPDKPTKYIFIRTDS